MLHLVTRYLVGMTQRLVSNYRPTLGAAILTGIFISIKHLLDEQIFCLTIAIVYTHDKMAADMTFADDLEKSFRNK